MSSIIFGKIIYSSDGSVLIEPVVESYSFFESKIVKHKLPSVNLQTFFEAYHRNNIVMAIRFSNSFISLKNELLRGKANVIKGILSSSVFHLNSDIDEITEHTLKINNHNVYNLFDGKSNKYVFIEIKSL